MNAMASMLIFTGLLLISESLLVMPNSKLCGGELTNKTGVITSPGYPVVYPQETSCEWRIVANVGQRIMLVIKEFQLDPDDSLTIYDNDPAYDSGKQKWQPLTGIISNGTVYWTRFNRVWLVFVSDLETASMKARFRIKYKISSDAWPCPDVSSPLNGSVVFRRHDVHGYIAVFSCDPGYILQGNETLRCISDELSGGKWSGPVPQCVAPCLNESHNQGLGDYFKVPQNSPILSPGYPGKLGHPGKCVWQLQVNRGAFVNLTAVNFHLDIESYVEAWDRSIGGRLLGNYSSSTFPKQLVSNSNTVYIVLRTSSQSTGIFELKYSKSSSTDCGPPQNAENMYFSPSKISYPVNDIINYRCIQGFYLAPKNSHNTKSICSVGKRWTVASFPKCVADCRVWDPDDIRYHDIVLRNDSGVILSPGYPGPVKEGACKYRIALGKFRSIQFDPSNVKLDSSTKIIINYANEEGNISLALSSANIAHFKLLKIDSSSADVLIESSGVQLEGFSLRYTSLTTGVCSKPEIKYGHILPVTSHLPINATIRISCLPFFHIVGGSTLTCEPGVTGSHWDPPPPSCKHNCGGRYTYLANGTIVTPFYPSNYDRLRACTWTITSSNLSNAESYYVTFEVEILEMSPLDKLTVTASSDNTITTVKSNMKNLTVFTNARGFSLSFIPIGSVESQRKFKLTYRSKTYVPLNCTMPATESRLRVISGTNNQGGRTIFACRPPYNLVGVNSSKCDVMVDGEKVVPYWNPSLPTCSLECGLNGEGQFTRQAYAFPNQGATLLDAVANPGYPNMIRGRQDCRWVIQTSPGYRITASFSYLDFPKQHKDISVQIFDGAVVRHQRPLLVETQYGVIPPPVTSFHNVLTIHYTNYNKDMTEHKGFYIHYAAVPFTEPGLVTSSPASTTMAIPSSVTPVKETEKSTADMKTVKKTTPETSAIPNNMIEPTIGTTAVNPDIHIKEVQTQKKHSAHPGVIASTVVIGIILMIATLIGGYYWYRKRHPVRMMVGQRFPKFHNPLYEQRPESTISLEKDFNLGSSSSSVSLT